MRLGYVRIDCGVNEPFAPADAHGERGVPGVVHRCKRSVVEPCAVANAIRLACVPERGCQDDVRLQRLPTRRLHDAERPGLQCVIPPPAMKLKWQTWPCHDGQGDPDPSRIECAQHGREIRLPRERPEPCHRREAAGTRGRRAGRSDGVHPARQARANRLAIALALGVAHGGARRAKARANLLCCIL